MQSKNPNTNQHRHSRRSACDRCKGYKLRCDRENSLNSSCYRCLKARVRCVTMDPPQNVSSNRRQQQSAGNENTQQSLTSNVSHQGKRSRGDSGTFSRGGREDAGPSTPVSFTPALQQQDRSGTHSESYFMLSSRAQSSAPERNASVRTNSRFRMKRASILMKYPPLCAAEPRR